MMIVNVPIEPLESRYSADWCRWFEEELSARQYTYKTAIGLHTSGKIKEGAFLDAIETQYYKASQVADIASMVQHGTIPRNERVVFLIHDGWFPVEQLAYMRDMLGCYEWKFVGIFHAGTYDRWDQTAQHGMYSWGKDIENGWFKIYNKIIVASEYHAQLLSNTRKIHNHKLALIPWKVEVPKGCIGVEKNNWIVFPHRYNPEKQPALYGDTSLWISDEWTMVNTSSCKTKDEYYAMLSKSKICVSFSLQETFGIAMVEAVLLGCIPLVPDRLSYKEMYPPIFRYQGETEFKEKLNNFCTEKWDKGLGSPLQNLQEKFRQNNEDFFDSLFSVVEEL